MCRLSVTKFAEGGVKLELTQSNGFPIALLNGLPAALYDELKKKSDEYEGNAARAQSPGMRPSAAPAAGGRRRKTQKKLRRSRAKWHNEYSQ